MFVIFGIITEARPTLYYISCIFLPSNRRNQANREFLIHGTTLTYKLKIETAS